MEQTNSTVVRKFSSRTKKRALFYGLMLIPFILHLLVFYLYVNLDTFVLAFKEYTIVSGRKAEVSFAGLKNFKDAWVWLTVSPQYYTNALKYYLWHFVFGFTLSLFFSYYMYKKLPGAGIFKYFLFLPHILSTLLLTILYKFLISEVYVEIAKQWFNVATTALDSTSRGPATQLAVVIVFNILIGFGTQVIVYVGTMEGIDPSLVESAQLDGTNIIQEFFLLTIPMIWTTFVTFLVSTLTGIFTTQLCLHSFYGNSASDEIAVIGYKMYVATLQTTLTTKSTDTVLNYPALSAVGLMITAVLTPVILFIRKVLIKLGPSTK